MAAAAPSVHSLIAADTASPPPLKVAKVSVDPLSVTATEAVVSIAIERADGSPLLPEIPKEDAASAVRTSSMVLSWARAQELKFLIETASDTISATLYSFVGTAWTPATGSFEGSHTAKVGGDAMTPAPGKVAAGKFRFRLTGLSESSPLCVRVSLESKGGKAGPVQASFATVSKADEPEMMKKAAEERERRIQASKAVTQARSTAFKSKSADLARQEAEAAAARRAADAERRQPVAVPEPAVEDGDEGDDVLSGVAPLRQAMQDALAACEATEASAHAEVGATGSAASPGSPATEAAPAAEA